MGKVCIILPTYNEAGNIEALIQAIFKVAKGMKKWDLHILVVDDNSPDGTGQIVQRLQKRYNKLLMLKGSKQGLGVAYIRGFKHSFSRLNPDVVFEMDADFSHPPELIPKMLRQIDEGADFVIGCRYIKGGATPDWDFSRGGNFFARIVAGLHKVHDCTSGFRAIRTSLLKKIDLNNLGAKGYSFQMNLLYEAVLKKADIREEPLVFYDRKKGKSKMKTKDMVEFFVNSFHLRLRTWKRFIKFAIVGGTGVIVNTGILALLTEYFGVYYRISSIAAIEAAILWNFFLNNAWTFKSSTNKASLWHKALKFQVISIGGALINWAVLVLLTEYTGIFYIVSNLIGIAVATAWNYLLNVSYTWREDE